MVPVPTGPTKAKAAAGASTSSAIVAPRTARSSASTEVSVRPSKPPAGTYASWSKGLRHVASPRRKRRRRYESTRSTSARWPTVSRTLHLPGA